MSSYDDLYSEDVGAADFAGSMPEDFLKRYPNLGMALLGCPDAKNKQRSIPPASVSFYWRDGHLGFCVAPKNGPKVIYGTFEDPSAGFRGIEDALSSGRCEVKPNNRKK